MNHDESNVCLKTIVLPMRFMCATAVKTYQGDSLHRYHVFAEFCNQAKVRSTIQRFGNTTN
ncbi:hypothetical protein ACUODJ_51750, partial [Escherichia sp. HC-CC]